MTGLREPPCARARPHVWVNCAASADGRLAYAGGRRARLSSPEDLRRVQRLRADSDAILVGVGTVVQDDPSLRVHWELLGEAERPSPARIIVDSRGRTPPGAKVLDGSAPTLVAVAEGVRRQFPSGVEVVVAGERRVDLARLFETLHGRGIRHLLVEGGSEILASVFRERLFDRCTVYYAPLVIGGRTAPPVVGGADPPGADATVPLELTGLERLGDGYLVTYLPGATGPTGARARS
jgi:2,5-diamino-6-(ribosylamino)-4(3H)-pyrimidinone 5'-phosphate reductase